VATIYLHALHVPASLHFALQDSPTKFGFLACGVYRVPLCRFPRRLRHCDTFKDFIHSLRLRTQCSRQFPAWPYELDQHKHYSHRRLCEHGLSSNLSQRLPESRILVYSYKLPVQDETVVLEYPSAKDWQSQHFPMLWLFLPVQ